MLHPYMHYFVQKRCTTIWKINENKLDFYSLTFVLSGSANYIINGKEYRPSAGNVVFVKPGETRKAWTEGMYCTAIDFHLRDGEDIDLGPVTWRTDFDRFSNLFQEIKYEWLQKKEGYQLKCQALFALVLHQLLYTEDSCKRNRHVETLKRYILEHYCEDLPMKKLADYVGLNPVYCGALFKKKEGRTIADFINQVRINKAADLLQTGEYNVGEVAERVGFRDICFFSNSFKRYTGIAPKKFKSG